MRAIISTRQSLASIRICFICLPSLLHHVQTVYIPRSWHRYLQMADKHYLSNRFEGTPGRGKEGCWEQTVYIMILPRARLGSVCISFITITHCLRQQGF